MRDAQAARAAEAQSVVASGLAIDQLHFGYDVRAIHSRKRRAGSRSGSSTTA